MAFSRWLSRVGFSKRSPEITLPIRSHQEFCVQLMNDGVCDKAHIVYRITLTPSRCRRRSQAVSCHPSTSCRSADFQTTCDGLSAPLGCTKGEDSEARKGEPHRDQNGRSGSVATTLVRGSLADPASSIVGPSPTHTPLQSSRPQQDARLRDLKLFEPESGQRKITVGSVCGSI